MSEAFRNAPVSVALDPKYATRTREAARSILVALYCAIRSIPFFFAPTPKTPLRVLCLIAFDTIHSIQATKPLAREQIRLLAMSLDLAADQNAICDGKTLNRAEFRPNTERLEEAGFGLVLDEHFKRIRDIESQRPHANYDLNRFREVRLYREAIVREHLRLATNIAFGADSNLCRNLDSRVMEILFRIVMQCQIIDDLMDYQKDIALGLPSFFTASASPAECFDSTWEASQGYRCIDYQLFCDHRFPFVAALAVVSLVTRLVILVCRVRLIQFLFGMPSCLGTPARSKANDILR